jgi:hypothetical protein
MKVLALGRDTAPADDPRFVEVRPAAAREAIDSLPLVAAGLIDFDLVPLKPYPGFARLFAKGTPGV